MGMLLGSEDFLVLPSSWLVTLYSCLEQRAITDHIIVVLSLSFADACCVGN